MKDLILKGKELKTLKDINYKMHITALNNNTPKSMKPTFTLNDMEMHEYISTEYIEKEKLKQEAIKWIKSIQDNIFYLTRKATDGRLINKLEIHENIGKSNILMEVFNITEEDLK